MNFTYDNLHMAEAAKKRLAQVQQAIRDGKLMKTSVKIVPGVEGTHDIVVTSSNPDYVNWNTLAGHIRTQIVAFNMRKHEEVK